MLLRRFSASLSRTIALSTGATHVLFLLFLQVEIFFSTLSAPNLSTAEALSFFAKWPFIQGQVLLVGILLALLTWILQGTSRWISFFVATAVNIYLVIDKTFFQYFFTHFRPSMNRGQFLPGEQILRSLSWAIDLRLAFDFAMLALITIFIYRNVIGRRVYSWQTTLFDLRRTGLTAFAVYFLVCLTAMSFLKLNDLETHPLVALLEFQRSQGDPKKTDGAILPSLFSPQFGAFQKEDPPRLKKTAHPPNILLVVLESVGSEQILDATGNLSETLTPFLYELRHQSILFPNIYTPFPATSIAHVFLQTGGYGVTSDSLFLNLEKPYRGATLPGTLAASGYATSMVSSGALNEGDMNLFYEGLGFEHYFDFNRTSSDYKQKRRLGPWGGDESILPEELRTWLDNRAPSDQRPFFSTLLTISTHHTYSVPRGYRGPWPGVTELERYKNSIHYTDSILRKIFELLEARNELENTIVFITGDHGQAFGDLHRHNYFHRSRLYEENVRSFLMVIEPKSQRRNLSISSRIGSLSDLMPTILSSAGILPPTTLGQNLLSSKFENRLAFFYKSERPSQWGLRDGQWKFIAPIEGDGEPQLYDLSVDATEQINIASKHPEKIVRYSRICEDWYYGMQAEFDKRMPQPIPGTVFSSADSRSPVPRRAAPVIADEFGVFRFVDPVPADRPLTLNTVFHPFQYPMRIRFEVVSPSGISYSAFKTPTPNFNRVILRMPPPTPLEIGPWQLRIWNAQSLIFETSFQTNIR